MLQGVSWKLYSDLFSIEGVDVMFSPCHRQVTSVKTIGKNMTLLNDCIVMFRRVYCLIADKFVFFR